MRCMEMHVYEPGANRGWGLSSWRGMASGVWRGRPLMWMLFKRSFVATYRQTLFGWVGTILDPMLLVAPFIALSLTGVLRPGDIAAPYPAFALLGLTMYHIANDCIRHCGASVSSQASLVTKINFPKEVLVFAHLGTIIVNMLVRLCFVLLFLAIFGYMPSACALLFPLAALPMLLFGMGIGLTLACLSVMMRDVAKYVSMIMPFFMLMSPILYKQPRIAFFVRFNSVNPFAALVNGPRDLFLYGYMEDPAAFCWMSAAALAVFVLGWRLFYMSEVHLAAQLGAK